MSAAVALSGLGWGDTLWLTDANAELDLIWGCGFRSVSIPHTMGDPAGEALHRVAAAVAYALLKGFAVRVPLHCDGNGGVVEGLPWTSAYLAEAQDLFLAIAATSATLPTHNLTIEVGNENYRALPSVDPKVPGAPDWAAMLELYTGPYPEVAKAAKQDLGGCRVCVPAPGDQQCGLVAQSLIHIPASAYHPLPSPQQVYDEVSVHYPSETASQSGIPLQSLLEEFAAYTRLPVVVSEMGLGSIAADLALGLPCTAWQWYCPGLVGVKGNAAALAALGYPVTRPT